MRGLSSTARAYICAVIATAGALIAASRASVADVDRETLAVLAGLFLICDSAPAKLNTKRARVSMSYAVGLAAVVLLGPGGAGLVGATAVATGQRGLTVIKRLFNGAQFAVCCYTAGIVYTALAHGPGPGQPGWAGDAIGPFFLALVTYVAVNLSLTGGILLLAGQATPGELRREFWDLALGILGYGMFGLLIAGLWAAVGPVAAVLVLLPLFIARWAFAQAQAQQAAYDATIAALCQAVETKDYYTRGHSERVSRGSVMIAEEIGMRPERVAAIRYAGMLHDVGKIGVPTKVLQKAGKLTEEEYAAVQLHPMRGLEIVKEIGFLDEALNGIMHHHEKMDGTGYPMGLAGDEIPEFARAISVADVFDTLTSDRSYRTAWTIEDAAAELRRSKGEHFDPIMVDAFLCALERMSWQPPDPADLVPGNGVAADKDHDDPTISIKAETAPPP